MKKDREKKRSPKTDLDESLQGLNEIGRGDFATMKEGKNTIRIVPWKKVFFFKAILHYGLKRVGGGKAETAYPCLFMFGEKSCPACDFYEELGKSGSEKKLKIATRIRPITKFYVNLLDRNRSQDGIKMYGFSSKMMRTLRGYLEDEDYGDITDPEEGKDVVITREGTGFTRTSYDIRVRAKSTPLDYDGWEDEIHDLEKEVVQKIDKDFLKKRIAELKNLMSGKPEEEEKEEEEEEEEKEEEEDKPGHKKPHRK